ncbi:MAG: hypothetical protein K1Y36_27280 [Blastocatellia bacterium]|nr:hypothetical protein [Blastocatellia bacterium]
MSLLQIDFACVLQGEKFDPKPFLSWKQIEIIEVNYFGDMGKTGRYKNKPYDFGYIRFTNQKMELHEFIRVVTNRKTKSLIKNADRKVLHVFIQFSNQCNWEISPEEMSKISTLGFTLTISCEKTDPLESI